MNSVKISTDRNLSIQRNHNVTWNWIQTYNFEHIKLYILLDEST